LQTTPKTEFTWKYSTKGDKWEEISSESGQYRNRVQLVNGHSPGNLSLLISHLTEEDGGSYRCTVQGGGHIYFKLTVKGCTLINNKKTQTIKAHTGGSVLLPCSCTEIDITPERFTWEKRNRHQNRWEVLSIESGQYKDRVQLSNGHSPGNLSLLISQLTEEDRAEYRCDVTETYTHIKLTFEEDPTTTTTSTAVVSVHTSTTTSILSSSSFFPTTEVPPQSLPFVPFALVTVIFLHVIVAVVYHTKRNRDPDRVHYSTADGDGVVSLE
ncbi:hypothetical protein MHYP_G00050220, partial [Metynnis hypsauchen]